mgnify:CR=1 FL=1
MNIYQCQKYAKQNGFDSVKFTTDFPIGTRTCKWLDAYFGMFTIEGITDGAFITVRDVDAQFPRLECEIVE